MDRSQMITNIDTEADIIRTRVVGDPVRAFEYQWTENEAKAFQAAGYAGAVPASISSWASAKQWTAQQACDDILAAAAAFRNAMATIRSLRLSGKEAVRGAESDAHAAALYDQTMNSFKNLRQQIGA